MAALPPFDKLFCISFFKGSVNRLDKFIRTKKRLAFRPAFLFSFALFGANVVHRCELARVSFDADRFHFESGFVASIGHTRPDLFADVRA